MIVCRCYGKDRIHNSQQLMSYLDSIEMEYDVRVVGEGVDGVNPISIFVIQSKNKEDIIRIHSFTNIPVNDFLFM